MLIASGVSVASSDSSTSCVTLARRWHSCSRQLSFVRCGRHSNSSSSRSRDEAEASSADWEQRWLTLMTRAPAGGAVSSTYALRLETVCRTIRLLQRNRASHSSVSFANHHTAENVHYTHPSVLQPRLQVTTFRISLAIGPQQSAVTEGISSVAQIIPICQFRLSVLWQLPCSLLSLIGSGTGCSIV